MKIAIVGAGIAGNVAAQRLHAAHEVTVFEAGDHVGGHTHTHDVEWAGERHRIDTGFIVFNDWTYPRFVALLDSLGVESQASAMSFSVRNEASGLEYNGTSLDGLFAQRRNLLRPRFHRMILDILRFNREAPGLLDAAGDPTLGEYLAERGYSPQFVDDYLVPMGAAIWSADPGRVLDFPARFFVRFFHNHGMLSVDERPTWRVIRGGSANYVERLTAGFRDRIRLRSPVEWIRRLPGRVEVKVRHATAAESFDHVFLACHSDQALRLLADATPAEREVLGAIPYQENEAVLHTDTSMLPRSRRAWAAWNYHVPAESGARLGVTYNMNILQGLAARETFCVTLNRTERLAPGRVIERLTYHHPLFTAESLRAQQRHREVNGARRTYFCGAYWRFGFHEDGVASAHAALGHFDEDHAQRDLSRVA